MRRLLHRVIIVSALTGGVTLLASCGVEFEPDRFCWKCVDDEDCGPGYTCRLEEPAGYCVEPDREEGQDAPCDAAQPE